MKRIWSLAFGVLGVFAVASGQWKEEPRPLPERNFVGVPATDLFSPTSPDPLAAIQEEASNAAIQKKSPWIAGGMSLILPGSGQFYSEDYLKSAIFLAVEVGAWVVAYKYDKKGDEQTAFFEGYADQNWSVVRYANYTVDKVLVDPARKAYYQANLFVPNSGALPDWEQVRWPVLNEMEREIGAFYSHTLPRHGDQQYFELIGKYPQYNQGWADANPDMPANYELIKANLTPQFRYYSIERGKANDWYVTATTFVTIAIVNHVVSAVEAAWTASSRNKVAGSATLHSVPVGGGVVLVPAVKVEYSF